MIPLAVTLSEAIRFVISVAAFIVIAAAFGVLPTPAAALAVPFMVIEILFTLGASYFFAATGVFFRDLIKITEYLFWILFLLGCGMYLLAMVPAKVQYDRAFQPVHDVLRGRANAASVWPRSPTSPSRVVGGVALLSVLLLVGGYVYFLQREGSFSKVVI